MIVEYAVAWAINFTRQFTAWLMFSLATVNTVSIGVRAAHATTIDTQNAAFQLLCLTLCYFGWAKLKQPYSYKKHT